MIAREDAPYRVNPYSADRRTPPRTTVHLATCHCVHAGSKWRSFATREEAVACAQRIARVESIRFNLCDWCNP